MNNRLQSHFFWGPYGPFSTLIGAGIIIMASVRLSHAIICAGAFLWVYSVTALIYFSARKFLPGKGKSIILLFLSGFLCSFYILVTGLINPLLVSGTWFFMLLIPPCCIGSGLFEGMDSVETPEILSRVCMEAFTYGIIIVAFSLIREPVGLGTLSLPGGLWGIYELFGSGADNNGFFPIQIIPISAGGFILLGFGTALFRFFRSRYITGDDL